jgi:kynurenine 3-monooxygenase
VTTAAAEPVLHIIGGGPAGLLLALLGARRGARSIVYERRDDPRARPPEAGRSINLALAARGIEALRLAGLDDDLAGLLVPMRGRAVHGVDGSLQLAPYGQRDGEFIHSVSRAALTRRLVEAAARLPGIELRFGQRCTGVGADGRPQLVDEASGRAYGLPPGRVVAADGAGSAVRKSLAASGRIGVDEAMLDHDYKELGIPLQDGQPALAMDALHIWPRGGFMLIALPNADGTFTATLFLPKTGRQSFDRLVDDASVEAFFAREFPGARALMPDLLAEFAAHRQGLLGTVYCTTWRDGESLLLLGDAAHAIVPFHGQGMNCAFEDCRVLDALLAAGHPDAFARYEGQRLPDCDAIAQMALENYGEMRDAVLDPRFQLQKQLSFELERRFPGHFIPRYAMVMFHAEIPYSVALERGRVQQRILDALTDPGTDGRLPAIASIDWNRAAALVADLLPPLPVGA